MRRGKRWIWRGTAAVAGIAALYALWIFGQVWYWNTHDPTTTAFMRARGEELRGRGVKVRGMEIQWVPYERISIHLKRALVAAEDSKFLSHEGFDWEGIQEAMEKNIRRGRVVAGGSTISQQLAKNLFLSGERTVLRKAQEAVITVALEALMSKRRILELYLNVIEWGEGIFGAEAAARHYFGTGAGRLTPWQAARLAAMVPNPRYYDRHGATDALQRRTQIILARMARVRVPGDAQ